MNTFLKPATGLLLGLGLLSATYAADGDFKLTGSFQTQAVKALYNNHSDNDFDAFWARANFGAKYSSPDFDATLDFRMWSQAFYGKGTEYFSPRIYFGNYKWAFNDQKFNLKFGHWETDWSVGGNFGTYLDKKIDGSSSYHGFISRTGAQDGFELGWEAGPSTLNALAGTTYDSKDSNSLVPYNRGYLRFEDNLKIFALDLTLAYRVNALDPMLKPAVITHRADAKASFAILPKLKVYGELAYITTGKNSNVNTATVKAGNAVATDCGYAQDSDYMPFFVGVDIPTAGILNDFMLEVEYLKNRDELVADADELAWSVALAKSLGRTKIQFAVFSDTKIDKPATGIRVTTSL
jgi:hypothetical protein